MMSRRGAALCGAAILSVVAPAAASAYPKPTGKTYIVTIKTSDGRMIDDCYQFSTEGTVTFSLGTYKFENANLLGSPIWLALPPVGVVEHGKYNFVLSGVTLDNGAHIRATGIGLTGVIYHLAGTRSPSCDSGAKVAQY